MSDITKMKCPKCGVDMNHHAEKVDYSVEAEGASAEFGGVIKEVHCCPGCGNAATRISS